MLLLGHGTGTFALLQAIHFITTDRVCDSEQAQLDTTHAMSASDSEADPMESTALRAAQIVS